MTLEQVNKLDDVMGEVFGKRFTPAEKAELREETNMVAYDAIMAMAEDY